MNLNTEEVKYDDATSDALAGACRTVAQNIDGALPPLKNSLTTALEDFVGHYADVAAANIDTTISDGRNIANVFRQLLMWWTVLKRPPKKKNETVNSCVSTRRNMIG